MHDRQLLVRGGLHHLADADEVASLIGSDVQTELLRLDDDVEHSAVRDVDRDRPELRNLDVRVHVDGEGGHVLECDAPHPAALDAGGDRHEPGRRLKDEFGYRLYPLDHAHLEEGCRRADDVAARHRRIFGLLHDHKARGRTAVRRGQDDVAAQRRVAAWLAQHQLPDVIEVLFEVGALLEHGGAWHVGDTAEDDPAGLTRRVQVDRHED